MIICIRRRRRVDLSLLFGIFAIDSRRPWLSSCQGQFPKHQNVQLNLEES